MEVLSMRMSDFVVREAIVPELQETTQEGVIREMIQSLHSAGYFRATEIEEVIRAVLRREALGSTGIGRCVAIPHTKHACVERLIGTVGLSVEGVDFNSLDGERVHVFVLLTSPQDRPTDHLRALENVSRRLRDDEFVNQLRQGKSQDEIWALLTDAEENN